jgi:hypothetical protein
METRGQAEPPLSHWHSVLACLELSEGQVADVIAGYDLHMSRLGRVQAEEAALRAALDAALGGGGAQRALLGDVGDAAAAAGGVPATGQALDAQALAADEVLERLEACMRQEHAIHNDMGCFTAGKVLNSAQVRPRPRAASRAGEEGRKGGQRGAQEGAGAPRRAAPSLDSRAHLCAAAACVESADLTPPPRPPPPPPNADVQFGRMAVLAYPYVPDVCIITCEVARLARAGLLVPKPEPLHLMAAPAGPGGGGAATSIIAGSIPELR